MAKSGFTMHDFPTSPSYLADLRARYYFPDYLTPREYRSVSRYSRYRRIKDDEENTIFLESINQDTIEENGSDTYITVDSTNENRLDIIAFNNYGFSTYWWVIALANEIIDPFDIPLGTTLRIPPLSSLYLDGGVLSS